MNRQPLFIALLAAAALLSITGFAQEARTQETLETRVTELENELENSRAEVSALLVTATEDAATVDAIVRYLRAQSVSATQMVKTLSTSESQGFAAGINFQSRETLLAGWRAQLAGVQKGLPGQAPVEEEPKRRSRR